MSDALNFLLKARPEAMGHYFAFLKDTGKHLDPKTRALISVITKVHSQTERGLRQYLKRALRDGCSPAEIVDALLMAFPALGLTKIVWAVDVILGLDLPEFRAAGLGADLAAPGGAVDPAATTNRAEPAPPAIPAEPAWHGLIATADLAPGATARIECAGRAVFAHHGAQGWQVFDSRCPHQGTNMPHSALQGVLLTCPKHGWAFDVSSGACTAQGDRPLIRHECKVDRGRLLARW
jgi:nitrite reductase/ring-hydroxylating ferredoxin subunit/alkylhydroperoxidase/carboxymuconolactone decarboxylase family protein YurZ